MPNPSQLPSLADGSARENLPIKISAMDVDSDQSVSDAIAAILKDGPIDMLVNNAGIEAVGSVEEIPLSKFRAIMETNFFGALSRDQSVFLTVCTLTHPRSRLVSTLRTFKHA
jgi:NAD(P)-dependent dehydrogenase (short-subunit alcohol dehydrogenase family)